MNAGRVELDLVAVGKDQVSAMLRQVEANVKKSAAEISASSGKAEKSINDMVAALSAEHKALTAIGAAGGPAHAEVAKGANEAIKAIDAEVAALQRQLAAMHQMGAAGGPLGVVTKQQIGDLERLKTSLGGATGATKTLGEAAGRVVPDVGKVSPAIGEAAKKMTTLSTAIVGGVIGGGISGVVGALTEMIGGLADLAIEFLTTEPRLDSFSEQMIATANDAAKLSTQVIAIGVAAETAAKQVVGMGAKTADVYARIARLNGNNELAAGFERKAQGLAMGDSIKEIEDQMAAAERKANEAQKFLRDNRGAAEKARLDVVAAQEALKLRHSQGLADDVQIRQLGLAVGAHVALADKVAQTEAEYRKADDAITMFADHLAALDILQTTIANGPSPVADVITKTPRDDSNGGSRDAAPFGQPIFDFDGGYISEGPDALSQTFENIRDGSAAEAARALAQMRDDAGKLADELARVADATRLVAEVMPEMSAALSEVQAITAKVAEGKIGLSEALAQGATAIAANAAKAIGGVRAEAAVRAAYEIGMGFATLANPVVSAGHFTAGALLGAVALGAGGGSSGGARSSSGGSVGYVPDAPGKGGGTTIWNISTLVTDPHTLQRANASSARATRGTGVDERSAA